MEITGGIVAEAPARRRSTRAGTSKAPAGAGRQARRPRDKAAAGSSFGDHTPAFMLRAVAVPA
jgi:hypothetical protein